MSARIVVCLLLWQDDRPCKGNGFNYAVESTRWSSYSCTSEKERELGFYRHDQRGGCLPYWRGSITVSSTKGVASGSGCTSIEQTKQSRYKFICNAPAHDQDCSGDVKGHNVLAIPFKRSQLQSHLQMHFKFEFKLKSYGQMLLFTQFKLVKHTNKVHIHIPCIFFENFRHKICLIWS